MSGPGDVYANKFGVSRRREYLADFRCCEVRGHIDGPNDGWRRNRPCLSGDVGVLGQIKPNGAKRAEK